MIMPVMGGRQAFELLRAIDDRVPVLLSTGFSQDEDRSEMQKLGLRGSIRKPFLMSELSRKVAEALKGTCAMDP
jgi:DNA-binding NarL/FixJ family response regulator